MAQVISSKTLASGGIFMCISAALHVSAILVTGFYISAILLFLVGLAYAAIARSLMSGSELWAKATLFIMAAGIPAALIMIWFDVAVPRWWLWPIVWADIGVVLSLGLYVWRR